MKNKSEAEGLQEKAISALEEQLKIEQHKLETAKKLLTEVFMENQELKKRLELYEKPNDDYKKDWTWVSKIVFIVKNANKPLLSSEIIALLTLREPELQTTKSKAKFISASLNTAVLHQRLIQYKQMGVRGYYYCLPEWIDAENQLIL